MVSSHASKLEELARAGSLLTRELDFKTLLSVLVEQTLDITASDLAVLYLYLDPEKRESDAFLSYRRGRWSAAERISKTSELITFIRESSEAVVLTERRQSPFADLFLDPEMQSGIALPLYTPKAAIGVLILNSHKPFFYNRERFNFLNSFTKLAGGMLHSSRLFQELKDYLKKIEELERYQENVFTSMTNLLITTDREGRIHYFNSAAGERLGLNSEKIDATLGEAFKGSLDRKILKAFDTSKDTGKEVLGVEGIYKAAEKEMDFSLNVSPLKGKRGQYQGLTILITDQTRERELQASMEKVVEERRVIKDMFSSYLSKDIVQTLMDSPELVRPGGGKKEATIFFADIRGYTSFSEGKDPEYIIEVLNEYFSEAVEIVIKYNGYIDKFIGDCIMAAWGVPLQTVEEDAVRAVSCALEIQGLVAAKERHFFKGRASKLKVGIGMHTGPLVAGNLGSSRRMDYTVIGDTVNIAARLEGIAEANEVIITQATCNYLGDKFKLEKRQPVRVKGKSEPIPIYRVKQKVS